MHLGKLSVAVFALCAASLLVTSELPADPPRPLGIFSGVTPSTAPAVVDGVLTDDERRDKIEALWDRQDEISPDAPHARWETRTGQIVTTKVATTAPSTVPADTALSSTLVSVHLNNLPARRALTEFGKQTGMRLFVEQNRGPSLYGKISLNANQIPLLEAVNELCCQGGFAHYETGGWGQQPPEFDPAHPRMRLQTQQPGDALGPWEVCGPFAFEVQQIAHSLELTSAGSTPGPLTIALGFESEPQLVVLDQSQVPTVIEAVDEKGHQLTVWKNSQPQPQASRSFWGTLLGPRATPTSSEDQWQTVNHPAVLALNWPDDAGRTLVHLRARTRLMVQMKSEMLDVDFSASPNVQTKTISGFECAVGPLSNLNPQQGSTQITIRRGKQDIRQWRQLCAAIRGITPRFPGSEGNVAYQVVQLTGSNSTDEQMTAGYYWFNQYLEASSPVKVTRFVLEVPTEIRVVEVPIEFDNLPLP